MKINNKTDLLGKEKLLQGLTYHPIPFPNHRAFLAKKETIAQLALESVKNYADREFEIMADNYGIEVSVNYEEGKFKSMILKGSGEQGELINDQVALQLVPREAKNKNKITLHALLTVLDHRCFRGGMQKHEVPTVLKQALLEGLAYREDREFVCRPYSLFIDGKEHSALNEIWRVIGGFLITGLTLYSPFKEVEENILEFINDRYQQLLTPIRGFIISDEKPWEEKAYPKTCFLFDETLDIEQT